jgi:hypothetical protein
MRITCSIAFVMIASGCGLSMRVGVGPTVDTLGAVGVEARVTGSFGPGDENSALVAGTYLGAAVDQVPHGAGTYGLSFGVVGVTTDHFAGHLDFLLGGRTSRFTNFALGFELGVGYAFSDDVHCANFLFGCSRHAWILGLGARVEALIDSRALFAFPLYLEIYDGT